MVMDPNCRRFFSILTSMGETVTVVFPAGPLLGETENPLPLYVNPHAALAVIVKVALSVASPDLLRRNLDLWIRIIFVAGREQHGGGQQQKQPADYL